MILDKKTLSELRDAKDIAYEVCNHNFFSVKKDDIVKSMAILSNFIEDIIFECNDLGGVYIYLSDKNKEGKS